MQGRTGQRLADVQMEMPAVALAINRAGIKGLKRLLRVPDRTSGSQTTMADVALAASLPPTLKGTHMSRLVEALEAFDDVVADDSLLYFLDAARKKLHAESAFARFAFPFLARRKSPVSGKSAHLACPCAITGDLDATGLAITLEVSAPVMTVCPCSLAISDLGAHSQRAEVRLEMGVKSLGWIEDFIEIAEESSSSAIYSLLKREDEKLVTERAFSRPMFVEDVVRGASKRLEESRQVLWFRAEVESLESIHGHNAFASISRDKRIE